MLDLAERLARGAGEILAAHYGKLRRADAKRKSDRRDLVSKADIESERYLLDHIPGEDDILSEEGSSRETGAARKWVIDPLDGTVNYLHGIPYWCVSIGIIEDGELIAGVVHAPELRYTVTAARGGGCHRNGEAVRVSTTDELADAVVATGFAYERNRLADNNLDNFTTVSLRAAGIRRMGAAALDMANVACGSLDGFWELHLQPWDVAAGILLVREAGGTVTDFHGKGDLDAVVSGKHIVATNGSAHEELRDCLAPLRGL